MDDARHPFGDDDKKLLEEGSELGKLLENYVIAIRREEIPDADEKNTRKSVNALLVQGGKLVGYNRVDTKKPLCEFRFYKSMPDSYYFHYQIVKITPFDLFSAILEFRWSLANNRTRSYILVQDIVATEAPFKLGFTSTEPRIDDPKNPPPLFQMACGWKKPSLVSKWVGDKKIDFVKNDPAKDLTLCRLRQILTGWEIELIDRSSE